VHLLSVHCIPLQSCVMLLSVNFFFVWLAIKNELIQQKQALAKQREEYVRKKMLIARELDLLRDQEEELLQEKSRDNDRILKENNKLQVCTLYVKSL
jgi:signal transduction histidine kinase